MSDKLSWKKYLLVGSEILGLCFNRLTAYHMDSCQNLENFLQEIQMQLFWKPLSLCEIFIAFFKIYIKFYPFWKKDQLHSVIIL